MIITKRQIELETVFLLTIAAAISVFFVTYQSNYHQQFNVSLNTPVAPVIADAPAKIAISSQISPDGTKKVIMKVTGNPDDTSTYGFSTEDENGANEQHIFTKVLNPQDNMAIPFNTWSPDDKYFFIQEEIKGNKGVFVFKATGEPFSDTEKYLDVTDLFLKRDTGNYFSEATGWASESLIIVNSKKPDNTKGLSYWFEVPSRAIIPLSTEF